LLLNIPITGDKALHHSLPLLNYIAEQSFRLSKRD
jgi:hypothetical protein